MKKTIVVILPILCLLQFSVLFAKSNWSIKLGTNYSVFRSENETELKPGFTFGIVRTKSIFKNAFFTWEVLFISKNGTLKEMVIPRSVNEPFHSVSIWDIGFTIYQVEIPFLIKYDIIKVRDVKLELQSGLGLSLSLFENTNITRLYSYDSPDPIFEYDARKTDLDPTSGGGGFMYEAGLGFEFPLFLLECRYSHAFFDIEPTDSFLINKELDSFHVALIFQPSKIMKELF
jgi:hypothetical protein